MDRGEQWMENFLEHSKKGAGTEVSPDNRAEKRAQRREE